MKLQKIFGPVLLVLGVASLIYGSLLFVNDDNGNWKSLVVLFVLGLIFFTSGLGIIKNIRDKE
ncbi:hypothetical protein JKA74_16095 [Marivirga sp. S37H4]|uniref:Uncharacterized protein n=1 Tax=Marivirga aurantiaca TaxID=2802615 RepID=A0A934X0C3_9BACT|nr:hypothetical protein [Marivirga aurantiaca]MBK6266568.1 hypothetical protein [Marivirga aurantiaca]